MKLNSINYASPLKNNTEHNKLQKKQNPSFGNAVVGLATFIENNGFLGEFLTIDTVGMMAPRTIQGYTRNRKELGRLNYKAGREEMVRELLSGPAFFYVPLTALTIASVLKGKSAKVDTKVLNSFKNVMKETTVEMKNAVNTKKNFVKTVVNEAFKDFQNEKHLVDEIAELMEKNATKKFNFVDKIKNIFRKDNEKIETAAILKEKATALVTKLNKANSKNLDNAGVIELGGQKYDASNLFGDMRNYLDDFTSKAAKSTQEKDTFIDKFHKKAQDLRYAANIFAVASLSAFLMIIPKLYQTGKEFPGSDGLNKGNNNATPNANETAKEVA